MPTLLRLNGFRFFFYLDDHEPKHVHVVKGQETAKIDLEGLEIIKANMKANSLAQALAIVKEHQTYLIGKWDEYLGNEPRNFGDRLSR